MVIRLATKVDIESIMKIIEEAKKFFKINNIPQWQQGTPNENTILEDIRLKQAYVLVDDEDVLGTFALCFQEDASYDHINQGRWLNDFEYGVLHRVAVSKEAKGNGYASMIMKFCEEKALQLGIENLRVDTHRLNESMQRLIAKNNYIYCGVVQVCEVDGERLAYQKVLKKA